MRRTVYKLCYMSQQKLASSSRGAPKTPVFRLFSIFITIPLPCYLFYSVSTWTLPDRIALYESKIKDTKAHLDAMKEQKKPKAQHLAEPSKAFRDWLKEHNPGLAEYNLLLHLLLTAVITYFFSAARALNPSSTVKGTPIILDGMVSSADEFIREQQEAYTDLQHQHTLLRKEHMQKQGIIIPA
jgi:hypothetical protein